MQKIIIYIHTHSTLSMYESIDMKMNPFNHRWHKFKFKHKGVKKAGERNIVKKKKKLPQKTEYGVNKMLLKHT